ncbi:MAG: hypothetical protein AAGA48_04110 [Myxococcota bacterium]
MSHWLWLLMLGCSDSEELPTIPGELLGPCPADGYRLCYEPPEQADTGEVEPAAPGRLDLRVLEATQAVTGPYDDPGRLDPDERVWLGGGVSARRESSRLRYGASRPDFDAADTIDLTIEGLPRLDNALPGGTYDCSTPVVGVSVAITIREQLEKAGWTQVDYESTSGTPCQITISETVAVAGDAFNPDAPPVVQGTLEMVLVEIPTNGHTITVRGSFVGPTQ